MEGYFDNLNCLNLLTGIWSNEVNLVESFVGPSKQLALLASIFFYFFMILFIIRLNAN